MVVQAVSKKEAWKFQKFQVLKFQVLGNGLAVRLKSEGNRKRGGVRSFVVGFSCQARMRLMTKLLSLNYLKLERAGYRCYFATGTYQRDLYLEKGDLKKVKKHIDLLAHVFSFKFKDGFMIWKLEFHKSGVPHFHFLFFVNEKWPWPVVMDWFSKSWVKSAMTIFKVSIEDLRVLKMLLAATNVRIVKMDKEDIVSRYVSKEVGKVIQTESVGWTGRYWGIINRKKFEDYVDVKEQEVTIDEFVKLRRVAMKIMKVRGYNLQKYYRMRGMERSGATLFTDSFLAEQLSRYLEGLRDGTFGQA